jgi:hypothetical protein
MVSGDYISMAAFYKTLPKFVPTPVGCGTYASNPNIHFFLCELVNMTDDIPDPSFHPNSCRATYKGNSVNPKVFNNTWYRGNRIIVGR